ncbi:MAG: TonB-dependent receptor [Gammaproteobacteria bacterium]|nr:TonB-dependent receptor [Gammaproteobacteria bacterium]
MKTALSMSALVFGVMVALPALASNTAKVSKTSAARSGGQTARVAQGENGSAPASTTSLSPIVVYGFARDAVLGTRQRLTPGAFSIVDGETFYRRQVTNMADALRYVPGVLMNSSTGGDDGVISIRGSNLTSLNFDKSGVLLLQDGLPVTTAGGANHNRLLSPAAARVVLVARGANALTYGASTLGGAINFITPTARNSDSRQLYLFGGSYGLVGGRASFGGVWGDFDGMLTVGGKHFSGWRQHSLERVLSLRGNTGWRSSKDFKLRIYATYIDSHQELAGALTRAEFDADPSQAAPSYLRGNHQLNVKTGRLAVKGNWGIDARSRLEFGLSYAIQSLFHPIVDVFNPNPPPEKFFSLLIDTTQRTIGGMARYHLEAGDHKVVAGINLAHTSNAGANYENDAGERGSFMNSVNDHADSATVYMMDRWGFAPRWTLVYGTQGVWARRDVNDSVHQEASYSSINPRAGVIYKLGRDSEAFASVSRIYEPPNIFQMNNDASPNDGQVLSAMQGISWEVGTRGSGVPIGAGTWRWSLSLYYAAIRDEILSVGPPGALQAANVGHTIHAGIEALAGGSFPVAGEANRIEPLVSLTWNHFRLDGDPVFGDNQLPYAPDYVVHGQVMYRNAPSGFYVGPTFEWVGSRYADMANTYQVDGYWLVGLRAGIQSDRWNLFVELRNITDKAYVNGVTVYTQAAPDARALVPGAPRSLFLGFRLTF